jgi:hypothetical protein
MTLEQTLQANLDDLFHLPLSQQAYDQFLQSQILLKSLITADGIDIWTYIWGSGHYYSAKAYKRLIGYTNIHPTHVWLWKSSG